MNGRGVTQEDKIIFNIGRKIYARDIDLSRTRDDMRLKKQLMPKKKWVGRY